MKIASSPILMAIIAMALLTVSSCKKNHEDNNDSVIAQIQAILPQRYIDSLKAHGFIVNDGKTPPVIANIYDFEPINDYDNSHVFAVGGSAITAKIKIANQVGNNASVYIKSWVGVGIADTSLAQIIAGTGNDFTVYAQAKGGHPTYTYD